jgi:protein involved in temperature-dependent protein secretion
MQSSVLNPTPEPQMGLFEDRPLSSDTDLRAIVRVLTGRRWQTAAEVARLAGWERPDSESTRRRVRKALESAEAREQVVSGPGTPGYCLTSEITVEEFRRACAARVAQIKAEGKALTAMRRGYHRYGKGGK